MRTSGRRISTQGGNGREIQMHPKSAASPAINDSGLRIHSTVSAQDENSLNTSTKRAAITSLDYQYSANTNTVASMLQAKFCYPFSSDTVTNLQSPAFDFLPRSGDGQLVTAEFYSHA